MVSAIAVADTKDAIGEIFSSFIKPFVSKVSCSNISNSCSDKFFVFSFNLVCKSLHYINNF